MSELVAQIPAQSPIAQLMQDAKMLAALKAEKKKKEEEIEALHARIATINGLMVEAMQINDLEQFVAYGQTYYLRTQLFANCPVENRETLIRRLRARKLGAIVKPTINAQTLNIFVREQVEQNAGNMPPWMDGIVTTCVKTEVATRKR